MAQKCGEVKIDPRIDTCLNCHQHTLKDTHRHQSRRTSALAVTYTFDRTVRTAFRTAGIGDVEEERSPLLAWKARVDKPSSERWNASKKMEPKPRMMNRRMERQRGSTVADVLLRSSYRIDKQIKGHHTVETAIPGNSSGSCSSPLSPDISSAFFVCDIEQ
ncbi:hypothetical protein BLNAU_11159 [Blattamonas nauphoetae]|uniref:Uncharacterized protein n=1 Tax=Blattamonas nauphoetae TaxID=2049346 RepID=A0ABQ9XQ83_9EUKA|nr:hypothetical protein BLNAU_11159 [Blattamonas nauphoetae]